MAIIKKIGYRIDPLDLDTRKAIGVRVPFNKKSVFTFNYTTKDQIKSNLINLLLTSQGERFHQPEFGIGIRDILFEQNTSTNEKINRLKDTINRNVSIFIPQIKINNISTTNKDNYFILKIVYKVLLDNDTNEVSLKF